MSFAKSSPMFAVVDLSRKPAPTAAFSDFTSAERAALSWRDSLSPAVLDDRLVRLVHGESRARLELGRAAARFLRVRGDQRLAFVRIGDYASERLGISGRELQSFAHVATKLEGLPLVAAAFARGEISWSHTRLLCAVADAESKAAWLEHARVLSVRELVTAIRRDSANDVPVGEAVDDASDSAEGEARVRFSIPCPGRIAFLWRRTIELARRMLGSQAPLWQAAEAIVAEASSSIGIEAPEEGRPETPEVIPVLARPSFEDADDEPPVSLDSDDAFELDAEMRELVEGLHTIDVELGEGLRRFVDLRLHRALGFASFDGYVRERLGISPAKARALVAVERQARDTAALGWAYRTGAVSWVKALALLPVASGDHVAAWVERARAVPVRRLQDEVEWALDERDAHGRPPAPPEMGARLERPDLQTCARSDSEVADQRVTFFGPASVVGLLRAGVSSFTRPGEPMWRGLERLLLHAVAEWEAQPRHRDPIFFRDGWRCSVPVCTSRRSLEDHHIEFRSRGGGNEQWNRLAVCAAHHHHAIHLGLVRASGRAPDDVVWELGLRPGRAPLLRFHGERYLPLFDNSSCRRGTG